MVLVYLIPLALAAIWCVRYDRQAEMDSHKSHRFWLLCIILSLITGLSYALGGDKQTYLTEFEGYPDSFENIAEHIRLGITTRGQMPGWVLLNIFAKAIFGSFYVVQLIEAFFINFAVFYTAKRYTQHVFLFSIFYFLTFTYFNFNTEVMREAFSIGFFLLATETWFRKKYTLTVVLGLLAIMFHVSAIVILLYPFLQFRITLKRFPWVVMASAVFWIVSNKLFSIIISLFLGQTGSVAAKILLYSSYSTGLIAFVIYTVIYVVAPFVIMYLGIHRGAQDPEIIRRKEQFMTFYLCIAVIIPSFLPLVRFLNYPQTIFLCLTTDMLYLLFTEKRHFISKLCCTMLIFGYSIFQYIAFNPYTNSNYLVMYFPYTGFWNEDSFDRTERQNIHAIINSGNTKNAENIRTVE